MRILLAEDSRTNVYLVQAYLKSMPVELDVASNGADALEKFQSRRYDVVLMDMQMPVMDGYVATQKIREWEREQSRPATPVLALTAHAQKEEEAKTKAAGCTAHLTKPISRATLVTMIEKHAAAPDNGAASPAAGEASVPAPAAKIRVQPPEGIEEAVPLFLDYARTELADLAAALERQDFAKVRFVGHDLKGTGGGFGFAEISAIGKRLEESAKASDGGEIQKQIANLASYLDRLEVVYP